MFLKCMCQISAFEEPIKHSPLVMLDGNVTEEAIDHACHFCAANHIPGTIMLVAPVRFVLASV